MNFVSYAQNYEDVMLWKALRHVEKGFYIDVGANDPTLYSVTKAFYDKGWQGINIEPVNDWFKLLQTHRSRDLNFQVAASNRSGTLNFFEIVDTGLSTTQRKIAERHAEEKGYSIRSYEVPCQTITQIYEAIPARPVHFLKIDVEGCEQTVLEGIDFSVLRPWIILVESTLPLTQIQDYEKWEPILTAAGYQYVYFDGLNRFYIASEHEELKSAFSTPPNIWDEFTTSKQEELKMELQTVKSALRQKESEYSQLAQQLSSITNSRVWKVTAPLRSVAHYIKITKKTMYSISRKSISFLLKRIKQQLVALAAIALKQAWLKSPIMRILARSPKLRYQLRLLVHTGSLVNTRSGELSPRAQQVFQDLKQAIAKK